jgi:hypothetical protein
MFPSFLEIGPPNGGLHRQMLPSYNQAPVRWIGTTLSIEMHMFMHSKSEGTRGHCVTALCDEFELVVAHRLYFIVAIETGGFLSKR